MIPNAIIVHRRKEIEKIPIPKRINPKRLGWSKRYKKRFEMPKIKKCPAISRRNGQKIAK